MKRAIMVAALLLGAGVGAQASPGRDRLCIAVILRSEELTFAPIFYHLVKTELLIFPPSGPAYQITVEKTIPWQAPPLRPGQRLRLRCNSAEFSNTYLPG